MNPSSCLEFFFWQSFFVLTNYIFLCSPTHRKCPANLEMRSNSNLLMVLMNTCSLGAENKALESNYLLPINISRNETCNDGYLPGSRLCFSCSSGYSHEGGTHRCNLCPSKATTVTVALSGGVFGMVGLSVFLYIAITDAVEHEGHAPTDGFKIIGLNFIQILALCATFPIQWPAIFTSLFRVGGAITALGKHFINLKCLIPSTRTLTCTTCRLW